jgi:hypothetical protein
MFRRKRRALAVALVCALFGVLTIGAPAARAQGLVEYALIVALLANPAFSDTAPPDIVITTPPEAASYAVGQAVTADYTCTDAGVTFLTSLLANNGGLDRFLDTFHLDHPACDGPVASGAAVDTSTPGPHSFTVNARDAAVRVEDADNDGSLELVSHPNTSTLTHQYVVRYPFAGFQRPIDNPPDSNLVKAGQAVPVKFSLGGNRGLGILAGGSPTSSPTGCSSTKDDVVTAAAAGNSTLHYDAATDTYTWVWKTDKGWAGTCRTLTVALNDGTVHTALFMFK